MYLVVPPKYHPPLSLGFRDYSRGQTKINHNLKSKIMLQELEVTELSKDDFKKKFGISSMKLMKSDTKGGLFVQTNIGRFPAAQKIDVTKPLFFSWLKANDEYPESTWCLTNAIAASEVAEL